MVKNERIKIRQILADPDLRRKLMVPVIQATQAREGIKTSATQAEKAYNVVTEQERPAFFDLQRYASSRTEHDRRESSFVLALREPAGDARFNVPLRDFTSIDGAPLAYRRTDLLGRVFRESPALEPRFATARGGATTGDDSRYVRQWWEVDHAAPIGQFRWVPFAKGGSFSRFYADIDLVVHWDPERRTFVEFFGRKGRVRKGGRPESLDDFFKPGLTWPLAASEFNVRWLPGGCIFGHKGPGIFPASLEDTAFLAGMLNSAPAEYILQGLTSRESMGGRWEVGVIKRLPIPVTSQLQMASVSKAAQEIHDAKASWDRGSEVSTKFVSPWLLNEGEHRPSDDLASRLDRLATREISQEAHIRRLYSKLNDEVYQLYGIADAIRATIEETLGDRSPEILWPQMEGKTPDQKRMEHVFRLLSYAVKRVIEADDDGILPYSPAAGEPRLVDRVRHELSALFPGRDANQLEVEITNELKRSVKGYRKTNSIAEWLDNVFFEYHAALYRNRPIYWHLASAQGTASFAFGALVHYHRFDKNRMAKLRSSYLRDAVEELKREAALAGKENRAEDRLDLQAKVEEAQAFDRKLQHIQEGHHEGPDGGERDYRILTPWKTPDERPKGWDPDIDDGVKVNIEPLEKASVLRIAKVT